MECNHCKPLFILPFLFSNEGCKRQKLFHFCTSDKIEFETFAKEFSRKRKGILIHWQSHFKLHNCFQKKNLELLNLRFWCMDEWNSVAKSFRTVSESWSRSFFSSLQIQDFQNLSVPFFNFFFSSFFFQLLRSQL